MLNQVKENLLFAFTLSLIVSYFASVGYYGYFHLDISTFLSIQDLTLIFAKWVWLTSLIAAVFIFSLYKGARYFSKKEPSKKVSKEGWWDKTLGDTNFKRRALVILPLLILFITLIIIYKIVAVIFSSTILIAVIVGVIIITLVNINKELRASKNLYDFTEQTKWNIVFLSYFFLITIPILSGSLFAKYITPDHIIVKFDDNSIINTTDSIKIIYIGKTSEYFFTYNKDNKSTTVFTMAKTKSFEIMTK